MYFIFAGKLPPPVSMNSLLHSYTGPVLICQGVLDPLNDANARADMFATIRSDVAVDKLQLGHCPMDENAAMVSLYLIYNFVCYIGN